MNRIRPIALTLLVAASAAAAACTGEKAAKIPLAQGATLDSTKAMEAAHALLGPDAKAQLDSGNASYRSKDYPGALVHYRAASSLAPQHAAPLFGIYMVARTTRDSVMADSALAGIRLRNGPLPTAPHSLHDSTMKRMHDIIGTKPGAG